MVSSGYREAFLNFDVTAINILTIKKTMSLLTLSFEVLFTMIEEA